MKQTKQLVIAALFAALCCIGTMIHVPTGVTGGYVHLGDAFVLFSGIFLGPFYGGMAAGIGSAMADLVNGYAIYVPATFVIKSLCAIVCGGLFHRHKVKKYVLIPLGIFCELIMVGGYFLFETGLVVATSQGATGIRTAVTSAALGIPFNLL